MKKIMCDILKVFTAGCVSVVILSLFCIVYLHTGVHITNESGATDYKWKSNQLKTTMVEGFSWIRMDDQGFNNSIPVQENVDILLMGSSHMEAYNIAADKNVGFLLNKLLPEYYTYNIGTSGHRIYSCANNLRAAVSTYSPSAYVIIETDRVDLDMEEMKKVIDGSFPRIKSYESGMLFLVQEYIPVVKNIYKQVEDWWAADNLTIQHQKIETMEEKADRTSVSTEYGVNEINDEYRAVLNRFLHSMRMDVGGDCKLIIMYQPPTAINRDGTLQQTCKSEKIELFSELCEKNEILFVDTTPAFEELYTTQHLMAHGFYNTAVGVGHLNEHGHRAAAETVAKVIREAK